MNVKPLGIFEKSLTVVFCFTAAALAKNRALSDAAESTSAKTPLTNGNLANGHANGLSNGKLANGTKRREAADYYVKGDSIAATELHLRKPYGSAAAVAAAAAASSSNE